MKITDLMIGDWFNLNENQNEPIVPVKIRGIVGDDIYVSYPNDDTCDVVSVDSLHPILLTPEILEHNGWDKDNMYHNYHLETNDFKPFKYLQFYWYEHRLELICNTIDEWQNHSRQRETIYRANSVYYVYQLQHSLKNCGLPELSEKLNFD